MKKLYKEWDHKGKTQHERYLGQWAIGKWTQGVAMKKANREKLSIARDFQLKRIAPITLLVWKAKVAER